MCPDVTTTASTTRGGAWAPLRHPLYRALWIAQFVSNIGTWMQTVGAQWLVGNLHGTPLQVSLVQAAITLPFFLVGLPAGALGDIVDRRRLLIVTQTMMLSAAAVLAAVTFSGAVSPWLLLGLTFAMGVGQGLHAPSWQAIVPELVERDEITLASALAGVNMNLARAVGPALGGLLVAAAGPAWTFLLNAISFLGALAVIVRWRREPREHVLGPEHIVAAMRTGVAYVRHAPQLRALFARAAIFVIFAGALWAILPVFVRHNLGLGSTAYGLLLADVGLGAVLGAFMLARLQHARSPDQLLVAASLSYAASCALCALVPSAWTAALALVNAGGAWITATSSLNGTAITVLPAWVQSRGLSMYTLVFQGGQALSAILWGVVTQVSSARTALGGVAGGLVVGLVGGRRWQLPRAGELDVSPQPIPVAPSLAVELDPRIGPILVLIEYRVEPSRQAEFRECMHEVGRVRKRTGAEQWGLFQDGDDPDCFVESFLVATWQEHLRMHIERTTGSDRAAVERAIALTTATGRPRTRHLFYAYSDDGRLRSAVDAAARVRATAQRGAARWRTLLGGPPAEL
jgi:MFS family permease